MKCTPPATKPVPLKDLKKDLAFTPELDERAELLALLGNPTRLKLLVALDRAGELCVCDLAEVLGVTQSAVSQHLAKFRLFGLVETRRDAQTIYYRVADSPLGKLWRKVALAGVEI